MVRAFIAIKISEEVRQKLVQIQEPLAKAGAQLKLVEPENLHLTLKFLGEVQQEKIEAIVERIREAVVGVQSFDIHVARVGVLPNVNYVRVVWAGVADGSDQVVELQRRIDAQLAPLGFPPERNFHPHVTIARVKFLREKARFAEFLKAAAGMDFGTTKVYSVSLEQSILTQKGPIYSTLSEVELKH
ncbi:MAG: RNA 2',3'-cyclic phosphodiesterase [Candidatus Hadarchaeales archaeon]